jgi:beta-galactosidase
MRAHWRLSLCLLAAALLPLAARAHAQSTARQVLPADFDWRFVEGDPAGAEAPSFADASWRLVSLPHDWSIEGRPDPQSPTGNGGGYYPAGVGWYRKTFDAPAAWKPQRVSVEFDGVYRAATVFLNGRRVGTRPSGYSSFAFDLTPHLAFGARNVLAVRVDNAAQPNSRWYSGSGIYRHVRVVVTGPTHVARWGVFVTTPEVSNETATVSVRTTVANDATGSTGVTVETTLLAPDGATRGDARSPVVAAAGAETQVTQAIKVANPALWSPGTPRLYRAVTRVVEGGKVVDEIVTPFGIRSVAWSVEKGFLLNGEAVELVGGSVHHDNGPLGAAAFDRAEERRVELLKAAGFNAVRTAHNVPSPAFLDACDRFGLLVVDEPFDVWKTPKVKFDSALDFAEWWQRDVDAMVLRDRNHPAIVMWGIGNEIPEVWTPEGAPLARTIADHVRSLDSTRPLTQAFPGATYGPNPDAAIAVVDVAGYNYNLAQNHAKDHTRVPARLMMTTESLPGDAFEQWQLVHDTPYVVGEFVWTAMDYLGESGIGAWTYGTAERAAQAGQVLAMVRGAMANLGADGKNPFPVNEKPVDPATSPFLSFIFAGRPWHAAECGDLDLTGFRKPQSYYRDILWNGGARVYATVRRPAPEGQKVVPSVWSVNPTIPSWTWPGHEGKDLQVEVYAGTEKVRLFLDDKLVGELPAGREREFKAVFDVPYAPGTLKAVGVNGDRGVAESVLRTAGAPARLRLTADRTAIAADGQDLSFVVVEALDADGRLQPNADREVGFAITGPGTIAAVGSGDGTSDEPYVSTSRRLFNGRALVVVRGSRTAGTIELEAKAPGLDGASVSVTTRATASLPALRAF